MAVAGWDEILTQLRDATLGQYDILGELGRGGMAAVYLAHEIALNRKVAIKVMSPGLLLDPRMVERFCREAVTAASLQHPNIVTIHSSENAARLHSFVREYVHGRPLDLVLRERGPVPVPVVLGLFYQSGNAIRYAHRRGVIPGSRRSRPGPRTETRPPPTGRSDWSSGPALRCLSIPGRTHR